jgi:3-deoxy-D-manno-octulosonate 8-phosphate phosphatase (KDO 8-P phosphatase)
MNVLEDFARVDVFVFDVDGVLTNGQLLITEEGHLLRNMNIKDGYALQLAVKKGYQVWVISGAKSKGVQIRLQKLGLQEVHINIEDKQPLLEELLKKHNLEAANVLYMGDDLPDFDCINCVFLPACPADAAPEILERCKYVSYANGGDGCVRDVIRKVLLLQGHWPVADA